MPPAPVAAPDGLTVPPRSLVLPRRVLSVGAPARRVAAGDDAVLAVARQCRRAVGRNVRYQREWLPFRKDAGLPLRVRGRSPHYRRCEDGRRRSKSGMLS